MARRRRIPIRDRLRDRIRDRRNEGRSPANIAAYARQVMGQFHLTVDELGLTEAERRVLEWVDATCQARRRIEAGKRKETLQPYPLTPEMKAEIVAQFAAELSPELLAEIGDDLDFDFVQEVLEQISLEEVEKKRQREEVQDALMRLPSLKRSGLTSGKTCEALGITKTELYRWASDGRLPPDGRMYLYGLPSDHRWVRAWLPATIDAAASYVQKWREQDMVRQAHRRRGLRPV
jgi:hypothetical protein